MKFSKILTIVLAVLCVAAVGLSLVSAINIGNDKTDNGKTDGTSSETPSDSPDETTPDGSQDPTVPTSDYLQGSVIMTSDYSGSDDKIETIVKGGTACVRQIDNVTYCYIRYNLTDTNCQIVNYNNQYFEGVSNVFRVSTDGDNWSLLNNYRVDYSGDWNQANVPRNGSNFIYISFYTITDNASTLEETLAHFESFLSENCDVYITNVAG